MTATAEPTVITTAADVLTDQLHRLERDRWHVAESLDNATDAVTFQTAQLQRLNDLIADIKATLTRIGQIYLDRTGEHVATHRINIPIVHDKPDDETDSD